MDNKIKVVRGNESYMIDPVDLPHAQQDGFYPEEPSFLEKTIKGVKEAPGYVAESLKDLATSAEQVPTFGFADELRGIAKAKLKSALGKGDYEKLREQYTEEARNELAKAASRSPYASTAGTVGGLVAMPLGEFGEIGTGSKTLEALKIQLPKVTEASGVVGKLGALGGRFLGQGVAAGVESGALGALAGAGTAETGETAKGAWEGAKTGALFGAATSVFPTAAALKREGESSIAKLIQRGAEGASSGQSEDRLRQMGKAYMMGKEGISTTEGIVPEIEAAKDKMAQDIVKGRKEVGSAITKAAEKATLEGKTADAKALYETVANTVPTGTPERTIIDKFLNVENGVPGRETLTPNELESLRQSVGELLEGSVSPEREGSIKAAYKALSDSRRSIKSEDMNKAIQDYEQFSRHVGDPFLNDMETFENYTNRMSGYNKDKLITKIRDELGDVLSKATKPGESQATFRHNVQTYLDKLEAFSQANPENYAKTGLPPVKQLRANIIDMADKSQILRDINRLDPHGGVTNEIWHMIKAKGAEIVGRAVGKTEAASAKAKSFFGADVSDKLAKIKDIKSNPRYMENKELMSDLENLEKFIRNKDTNLSNAVLFKMLQNENSRKALTGEEK